MNKKKLIIYGTGRDFRNGWNRGLQEIVQKKYEIVGFVDKNRNFPKEIATKYVCFDVIPFDGFDSILITSSLYYFEIYSQIIQQGINKNKILPVQYLRQMMMEANETDSYKKVEADKEKYISMHPEGNFRYLEEYRYYIDDSNYSAGSCGAYYWQDLWAAERILERKPAVHYDIGSRIDGFIAHLQASKQKTCLIDIRPMDINLPYVSFRQADATNLRGIEDNSIESISALCSLEHFGLGRYGDEIDPEACFRAFDAIQRVTMKGGHIYIAVPVGWEHVEFNAHRVFYISTIVKAFSACDVVDIHVNTIGGGNAKMIKVDDIHAFDEERNTGAARFGLFEFVKSE